KRDKDKEIQSSLMVACLKRLLPVGLNLFAGKEQELVQHCKDRYLKVLNSEVVLFIKCSALVNYLPLHSLENAGIRGD
uniref:hypothetical protein n=1 Tax=Acinetobacter baumannii TaxID=470 RepID=UPI00148EF19D